MGSEAYIEFSPAIKGDVRQKNREGTIRVLALTHEEIFYQWHAGLMTSGGKIGENDLQNIKGVKFAMPDEAALRLAALDVVKRSLVGLGASIYAAAKAEVKPDATPPAPN